MLILTWKYFSQDFSRLSINPRKIKIVFQIISFQSDSRATVAQKGQQNAKATTQQQNYKTTKSHKWSYAKIKAMLATIL